jgi:hypothetical protein
MRKICLIYTGGTIGMKQNPNGKLAPVDFDQLRASIPALELLPIELDVVTVDKPVDSSEMQPEGWIDLVERIEKHYQDYDGFVLLHGTDTMAYTASALSFLIQGLKKPIIITGSQLPVGVLRTDATENLLSALEFAAMERDGEALIQEVCIYFEYKLYRGNRAYKRSSNEFDAFSSPNYPALAESGVRMSVYDELLWKPVESTSVPETSGCLRGCGDPVSWSRFDKVAGIGGLESGLTAHFWRGKCTKYTCVYRFFTALRGGWRSDHQYLTMCERSNCTRIVRQFIGSRAI